MGRTSTFARAVWAPKIYYLTEMMRPNMLKMAMSQKWTPLYELFWRCCSRSAKATDTSCAWIFTCFAMFFNVLHWPAPDYLCPLSLSSWSSSSWLSPALSSIIMLSIFNIIFMIIIEVDLSFVGKCLSQGPHLGSSRRLRVRTWTPLTYVSHILRFKIIYNKI